MHNNNNYTIAEDKEKAVFLQVIDKRLEQFRNTVSDYSSNREFFTDLSAWLNDLQAKLKEVFSEWYENNAKGRKIPENVVIPKPRQDIIYKKYTKKFLDKACEVCGNTRVLNIAHIIPREDGGKDEEWNFMRLCANHHYLFDQGKLTKEEWDKIDWKKKNSIVRNYALNVRKKAHEHFWKYGDTLLVLLPDGTSKRMDKYGARKLLQSEKLEWSKNR